MITPTGLTAHRQQQAKRLRWRCAQLFRPERCPWGAGCHGFCNYLAIMRKLGVNNMNNEQNIKVYLDTCVLSNILDEKINDENLKALNEICDYDFANLVTSKKTLEEFLNTKNDRTRFALKVFYKIISKIPSENLITLEPALFGSFMFGEACFNGSVEREDQLYTELKQIFSTSDAEHIFQATKSNCNFFLTLDYLTILKRVSTNNQQLKTICPNLSFVDAVTLLDNLKKSS